MRKFVKVTYNVVDPVFRAPCRFGCGCCSVKIAAGYTGCNKLKSGYHSLRYRSFRGLCRRSAQLVDMRSRLVFGSVTFDDIPL